MAKRTISILGATGSIGDSTLNLIRHHKDKFDVTVLTAGFNITKLIELAKEFKPTVVACANPDDFSTIKSELPNIEIMSVADAANIDTDWTMAAIVGTAGLIPTMNAIKKGKTVAFASKECLVAAGNIMMMEAEKCGTTLLPVDSEHNAIYQVFNKSQKQNINRLILTASGGPFRSKTWDDMLMATPQIALAHPTWIMGAKISIDSATLMNKALEVIEAHYLFDMPSNKIDVIIHPQSLIHSMVEYKDGSILSQMGPSDMKTPIAYCLGHPTRIETSGELLDFEKINQLTFEKPDIEKFKSLAMVRDVLDEGQAASIIFNASNEIANASFLDNQITLTDIYDVIDNSLQKQVRQTINTIDDVTSLDMLSRQFAKDFITKKNTKVTYA